MSSNFDTACRIQTSDRWVGMHRAPVDRRTSKRNARVVSVALLAAVALPTTSSAFVVAAPPAMAAPLVVAAPMPVVSAPVVRATKTVSAKVARARKLDRVMAYAMAQRGDRYRFGATGPNRWDCSGLVSVSYNKNVGTKLPHFTGALLKKGSKVSRKNLQPGDIVFPSRGHVAIYVGHGNMIAASSGAGKVKVQKMYGFYTARRIL